MEDSYEPDSRHDELRARVSIARWNLAGKNIAKNVGQRCKIAGR
jgi:hypothetical protein